MAENILSNAPGVYSQIVDNSYLAPAAAPGGLAVVGPTEKGQAYIPTSISSFTQYSAVFGLGSDSYIPQTVANYLQSGNNVQVTRVLGNGGWTFGTTKKIAALISGSTILAVFHPTLNDTPATANFNSSSVSGSIGSFNLNLNGTNVSKLTSGSLSPASNNYITKVLGTDASFETGSGFPLLLFGNYAASQSMASSASLVLTDAPCTFTSSFAEGYDAAASPWVTSAGGVKLFRFVHKSHGTKTNKDVKIGISNITVNADPTVFTKFNVVVRAWNDTERAPQVLEQFPNVTLDPSAPNYVGIAIGDKYEQYDSNLGKVVSFGDFDSASNYIRIELAEGVVNEAIIPSTAPAGHQAIFETIAGFTGYRLPAASYVSSNSGSSAFSGFDFYNTDNLNYLAPVPSEAVTGSNAVFTMPVNDNKFILPLQGGSDGTSYSVIKKSGANITTDGTNLFGFDLSSALTAGTSAYRKALDILSNKDAYQFNLLALPGVIEQYHSSVTSYATTMVENRADAFLVTDLTGVNTNVSAAISTAASLDSTLAGTYYPWVQVTDIITNKKTYMPPTVVIPGAVAYSDSISAPWFAVSGTERGVLGGAIDVKNKLSQSEIGLLYAAGINCIIKKPNTGVIIWGNKTTQTVETALSSMNVSRLVIELKKYIENVAFDLVWDNNTSAARNSFLRQVNPYLESVQSREGLFAFNVIMDERNNSNADIDRKVLNGLIQIQPTRAIEYVFLTFNITPTGVEFA